MRRPSVPPKPTEGAPTIREAGNFARGAETVNRRARGRPKGSKNKPKSLIPKELASEFLGIVRELLPPENYEEMRQAVMDGKNISTLAEAKITLKLMGPPIWRALIEERKPKKKPTADIDPDILAEIGETEESDTSGFGRPLNERMKIYLSMLQFIDKVEERHESARSDREKPQITVLATRGIDAGRLRGLVEIESGSVGGSTDRGGWKTLSAGTLPSEAPERQVDVPDSEQVEADGTIVGDIIGDSARSVHEDGS